MQVDEVTVADVVKRLRRIEGQVAGIVRMIEDGRDCEDVVTQLSAASRALSRAGFKIVASGMRQSLDPSRPDDVTPLDAERMERLFLSLA
jgi:DNA-binding FrmR family transcriptional regulator